MLSKKNVFCFVVCLWCHSIIIGQNTIIIQSNKSPQLIGQNIEFLEDESGNLTIEDIVSFEYQTKFKKNNKSIFAHPATASNFWLKFTVENHTEDEIFLELNSIHIWHIDFYASDSIGNYSLPVQRGGSLASQKNSPDDVHASWFLLNTTPSKKTYYVKISSGFVAIEAPLYIGTYEALRQKKSRSDFLPACFMGIVMIMFLYNLFIYLFTKDHI